MKAHDGHGLVEWCNLVSPIMRVLPDDIIVQILLRLPVKSLLQFKSVCKSWRTLISSPQFAMDNFRQRSSAYRLPFCLVYDSNKYICDNYQFGFLSLQPLFMNPSATISVVCFEMDYNMGPLFIRGSCNGLLCLHRVRKNCICLWNPCTRSASQWLPIDRSLSYFGFGYDQVHDKYKFVTVHGESVTRIYTFGANSCSFGPNFPYPVALGLFGYIGKFLSGTGTINWMAKMKEKNWVILSLDLANETFRQVSLPTLYGASDNYCDPELQILRNCLCFSIDHRDIIFDVWMMKDYGVWGSWTLISRVNLWRQSYSYPLTLISISENDVLLLMIPDGRLVLFKADVDLFCYPQIDSSSDGLRYPICSKGIWRCYFVHHDSLVVPPQ